MSERAKDSPSRDVVTATRGPSQLLGHWPCLCGQGRHDAAFPQAHRGRDADLPDDAALRPGRRRPVERNVRRLLARTIIAAVTDSGPRVLASVARILATTDEEEILYPRVL